MEKKHTQGSGIVERTTTTEWGKNKRKKAWEMERYVYRGGNGSKEQEHEWNERGE